MNKPIILVVVAAIVFIGAIFYLMAAPSSPTGLQCLGSEGTAMHIHSKLFMFVNGEEINIPRNVGIKDNCLYELHTHTTDGIIHMEAVSVKDFSLGQFFDLWGKEFDNNNLMGNKVDDSHQMRVYADGNLYTGDYRSLPLKSHEVIYVEYGPPFVDPEPYEFTGGL